MPRPFLSLVRSSLFRFAFSDGTGLFTRPSFKHGGIARFAVASTLGLSLVTLYTLYDTIHAEIDAPTPAAAILALRKRKSIQKFDLDASQDTEAVLRRYQETHRPPARSGILRYDVAQAASNDPLEDDHAEAFVASQDGDSQWSFFAVLDGHLGWETSAFLREELIPCVTAELSMFGHQGAESSTGDHVGGTDPVSGAVRRAFTRLDDQIVHGRLGEVMKTKSRNTGINLLAPAYAGACALLGIYDSQSRVLRVALTGDCRAVLGRRRVDGRYDLEVLTVDQNGNDPAEKKRLENAHPGEEVVKNGRTMGFGPSRVFGDARYKWSRDVQEGLKEYLGRTPPASVKTPPYFTAEPVVTATCVQPGDFVVLATDGLWECLTNREVVGLVGHWIQRQEGRRPSLIDSWTEWWGNRPHWRSAADSLPVVCDGKIPPDDTVRYVGWRANKKFVSVDENAATHLLRNALGGADKDLLQALLSMRTPRARTDDITATVVFFGEDGT